MSRSYRRRNVGDIVNGAVLVGRNNHLVTYKGETKTLVEWAEILGMNYHTLKHRINRYGYTADEAFEMPVGLRRGKTMEDVPDDDKGDK